MAAGDQLRIEMSANIIPASREAIGKPVVCNQSGEMQCVGIESPWLTIFKYRRKNGKVKKVFSVMGLDFQRLFSYLFFNPRLGESDMPRKIRYCENHPNVVASDTCHQCRKRICFNCCRQAFGQVFCSAQCMAVFFTAELMKLLFQCVRGIIHGIGLAIHFIVRGRIRGWFELLLLAGLIVSFFFIRQLTMEVRSLHDLTVVSPEAYTSAKTDTSDVLPPRILAPSDGGMVLKNILDITGEAESNHIVSLSIDGRLIKVMLPDNNSVFTFKSVRLHRGVNRLDVRAISEDGIVSSLETLTLTLGSPTRKFLARDVRRGPTSRKQIALTFDGGGENNAADEILDYLKFHTIQSTFFLTGEFIRRYPQTVKRIIRDGHEVGNHTWSHPHLTSFAQNRRHDTLPEITSDKLVQEFAKTASLFRLVTGQDMASLWRAPFGEVNSEIVGWAADVGYRHVGWTVGRDWQHSMDTLDWVADSTSAAYRSAEEITEKVLQFGDGKKQGANGAIVLMHLGTQRTSDFPHQKLPDIIDGLEKQGYKLVKITEMLAE